MLFAMIRASNESASTNAALIVESKERRKSAFSYYQLALLLLRLFLNRQLLMK